MVAVVARAWSAKVLGHAPFKVNVGLNISVVSVANYDSRSTVVASAGIRHSYGVGPVVFDACAILCFSWRFLGLQVLNVSKSRHLANLVGTQQHADSVGAGFNYLTDFGQQLDGALHLAFWGSDYEQFYLGTHPGIVRNFVFRELAAELHAWQQGRTPNQGQAGAVVPSGFALDRQGHQVGVNGQVANYFDAKALPLRPFRRAHGPV